MVDIKEKYDNPSVSPPSAGAPANAPEKSAANSSSAAAPEPQRKRGFFGRIIDRFKKEKLAAEDPVTLRKTPGEWFYDGLQQVGGKIAIIGATAVFGFLAKYGKRWYGPVPNVFKMADDGFKKILFENPIYPLAGKHEKIQRLGHTAANTAVLFWGGAIFAPFMRWLENNREKVANWYNRRWGKPGDVEIAHERLKDEPHQTWGDIFKGRIVTAFTIFAAMTGIDFLLGKGKVFGKGRADKYRFDQYSDAFGRWLTGFTKKGQEIWNTSLSQELTDAQKQNKLYQFGDITALDFYATNVGIIMWSLVSRRSAQKRHMENKQVSAEEAPMAKHDEFKNARMPETISDPKFTNTIKPRTNGKVDDYNPPAALSEKITARRETEAHFASP